MAIKGLSDVVRLPRLGKIRLGERVVNEGGKEHPRATEHFVAPPEVQAVYGAAPTSLEIMFPVEDQGVFASQFYRSYSRDQRAGLQGRRRPRCKAHRCRHQDGESLADGRADG